MTSWSASVTAVRERLRRLRRHATALQLFRNGLLAGQAVALAGELAAPIAALLTGLGASTNPVPEQLEQEAIAEWARQRAPLHGLVLDVASAFADGGLEGLRRAMDFAWARVCGVGTGAMIDAARAGEQPSDHGGRIVLICPAAGVATYAGAAAGALENLARTLSIEWARYAVTTIAIAPTEATRDEHLARLVAYLLSPAGGYFSGCRLELGGPSG